MEKELGKLGRDKVTGFEGIITILGIHLYGCNTFTLTPRVDKDGKAEDSRTFDMGRIEIIGEGVSAKDVAAPDGKTGAEGDLRPRGEAE